MKRPEQIVMWTHVDKKKSDYVNHLGKPLFKYSIEIPSWMGLAYNPRDVKIEIRSKNPSFSERFKDGNRDETRAYFKETGVKKYQDEKTNHNYMQVFTLARDTPETRKLTVKEYNQYHQELRELNAKYGVNRKVDNKMDETQ